MAGDEDISNVVKYDGKAYLMRRRHHSPYLITFPSLCDGDGAAVAKLSFGYRHLLENYRRMKLQRCSFYFVPQRATLYPTGFLPTSVGYGGNVILQRLNIGL